MPKAREICQSSASLLFRIAEFMDVRPDYFFRGYTDQHWKAA